MTWGSGHGESLTTTEARLLRHLVDRSPVEVSHDELLREVWGYAPSVESRAPYFAVRRLRAKVERDPATPRHLLTVHGTGYRFLPFDAPPSPTHTPGPPPDRRTNLTLDRRPPIGREVEQATVSAMLAEPGLVTLVGPPGVGKTRLARAVASAHAAGGGEVWFCDASEATDAEEVAQRVAQALGANGVQGFDALRPALAARRGMWLVLDNLEQVLPALAPHLGGWLAAAPELRVLATSRATVRLATERVFPVAPLERGSAVGLLRARAAALGRTLGPELDPALGALADRLEGLPLALELAAARLGVLSPAQVAARLSDPLAVLSHASHDAQKRHRSLRDAIDGSWRMLTPAEQRTVSRLATFRGGFWLEEAEQVIGVDELDLLQSAVEHSLVQTSEVAELPGHLRFSLLLSVRAYAEEQLGDDHDTAIEAHGRAMAALADRTRRSAENGLPSVLRRLRIDRDNLRVAADRASDPAVETRIRLALDAISIGVVHHTERTANADAAVRAATASGSAALTAEALLVRARARYGLQDRPDADLARAEALAGDDDDLHVRILLARGHDHLGRGEAFAAQVPLTEARRRAAGGDPAMLERVLQVCLHQVIDTGSFENGAAIAAELVAVRQRAGLGDRPVGNLAVWYSRSGQYDAMRSAMAADLIAHRRDGDRGREALTLVNIAFDEMDREPLVAEARFSRAVQIACELGDRRHEALGRYNHAVSLLSRGEIERAEVEARASLAAAVEMHNARAEAQAASVLALSSMIRQDATAVAWAERWVERSQAAGDAFMVAFGRLQLGLALVWAGRSLEGHAVCAEGARWISGSPFADRMVRTLERYRVLLGLAGTPEQRERARSEPWVPSEGASGRVIDALRDRLAQVR